MILPVPLAVSNTKSKTKVPSAEDPSLARRLSKDEPVGSASQGRLGRRSFGLLAAGARPVMS